MQFICPGGDSVPTLCPEGFVHSPDYTRCICPNGYYSNATCVPCEPGFYCLMGERAGCPAHTYQDATGQSACLDCTDTGDQYGLALATCNGNAQVQWCDPAVAHTQDRKLVGNCINCAQCNGLTGVQNGRNCYRS